VQTDSTGCTGTCPETSQRTVSISGVKSLKRFAMSQIGRSTLQTSLPAWHLPNTRQITHAQSRTTEPSISLLCSQSLLALCGERRGERRDFKSSSHSSFKVSSPSQPPSPWPHGCFRDWLSISGSRGRTVSYQPYHERMAQISEPPFGRFGFVHRCLPIKSINSALPALSRRSRLS
jgi:hypothetical protein